VEKNVSEGDVPIRPVVREQDVCHPQQRKKYQSRFDGFPAKYTQHVITQNVITSPLPSLESNKNNVDGKQITKIQSNQNRLTERWHSSKCNDDTQSSCCVVVQWVRVCKTVFWYVSSDIASARTYRRLYTVQRLIYATQITRNAAK
jgi:hypothetical protein